MSGTNCADLLIGSQAEMNMNDKPVFALEQCLDRVESDVQFLVDLIDGFLRTLPQQFHSLNDAIAKRDANSIERQAHTIKGALRNLGAEQCGETALKLEQAAKSLSFEEATTLLDNLKSDLQRFEDEFRHFAETAAATAVS